MFEHPGINQDLLAKRYAQGKEKTWDEIAMRVAKHAGAKSGRTDEFYETIYHGKFFPSRMTYMGTDYPFASSCFVFPVEDSLTGIMQTLSDACQVQKYGGGCIGGESVVLTDHGPIPIKDLVEQRNPSISVLSYDPQTHKTEYRSVADWHITHLPGHRIYEITFGHQRAINGAKLRASNWHPFFVFNGEEVVEVRADELKPGMSVIGATEQGSEYDPYFWLLGYVTGDGSVDMSKQKTREYGRVRIVDSNESAIERASAVLYSPYRPSPDSRYQSDVWSVESTGYMAEKVVEEYDYLPHSHTKHIPQQTWETGPNGRFSFLVGYLDADGWFCREKRRFYAYTVSERLAREIVALAGSLGVRTSVRVRPSRKENERDGYEISFERSQTFTDKVCTISTKYDDLQTGAVNGSVPLSHIWRQRLEDAGIHIGKTAWREAVNINGRKANLVNWLQNGITTRETAGVILDACGELLLAQAVRSARIVREVRQTGVDETLYDLTIPETQTYIASDPSTGAFVVVHNTGYNFGRLRPKGALISTSGGDASGPVSFMGLFHNAMEVVHRAGKKHAAQMGILNCDHPDIFDFIQCKDREGAYWTFNISVAITDKFMEAVRRDEDWNLQFNGKIYKTIKAKELWDYIVQHAWHNGDPGVIFIDTVNRNNCYPEPIEACNPCGEQMLPPYVSCNLGSIDLSRFVINGEIDWDSLEATTRTATRFLDGSVEAAFWPVDQIREKTHRYRNMGIGVMGWADMLILSGIPYDSQEAVELGEKVMKFINDAADDESRRLGGGERKNTTVTSIAPTGSISLLASCSSGIEPLFGIVTMKNTYVGSYNSAHWIFESIAKARGFYSDDLMEKIATSGSIQHLDEVPDDVKRLFKTTMEIDWEWHVRHQAAFQAHTDNAVSKTINLPNDATIDDVEQAYMMAYETGCKSITVYRDGSRQVQVMDVKTQDRDMCPNCNAILFMNDGEKMCVTCGYKPEENQREISTTEQVTVSENGMSSQEIKKARRDFMLNGKTYRKDTPIGTAYVTINSNGRGPQDPFEVFLNVGKAGSEVSAVSEALGRLMSLILRMPSAVDRQERLSWIADELASIGGGRPLGIGPNRVRSLPDGVAQILMEHLGNPWEVEVPQAQSFSLETQHARGDICPDCGEASLINTEGCRKCHGCGYSEC
ncbi:hypothetical protein KFU94_17990 [Chloroflexi bacterium TSY]|nr:hypothetical protein [Chloroflexi bacterium TSY]